VIDPAEETDDASCRSTAAGDAPEGPTSPRASRETAIRHEAATRCLSVTISH